MARRTERTPYDAPSRAECAVRIREMLADPGDMDRERVLYWRKKLREYGGVEAATLRDDLASLVRLSGWQVVMDALQEMAPKDSSPSPPNTHP